MKLNERILTKFIIMLLVIAPINIKAYTKTEAIYSNLDHTGSVKKTIINAHLSNLDNGEVIDYTNLEDIKNINGKEKFTRDSDKITFQSTGKDIYYQGKINNEMPIAINVKYYLNNKEVTPSKIINKKGNIRVEIEFANNDYNASYGMYTPYVVNTTTIMNNKYSSNYNITNGKSVSTGEKTVITAISCPGLYSNTNISEFSTLDKVVLTYETEKFENLEIYFTITPKLLSEIDINKIDEINNKVAGVNDLKTGVEQLSKGADELKTGMNTLDNGISSLSEGVESALDGSNALLNGANQLNVGINKISEISSLVDNLYSKTQENENLFQQISAVTAQIDAGISSVENMKNNYQTQLEEVNNNIIRLEVKKTITELTVEEEATLEQLYTNKQQLIGAVNQTEDKLQELNQQKSSLEESYYKLLGANESINQILCGILNVSSKDQINDTTITIFKSQLQALKSGSGLLSNGITSLNNGLGELYDGSKQLKNGSTQLNQGTDQLSEGIKKLESEGISKIVSLSNKVLKYSKESKKLIKLSKEYKGFASNNSDSTIFIYKLSTSK